MHKETVTFRRSRGNAPSCSSGPRSSVCRDNTVKHLHPVDCLSGAVSHPIVVLAGTQRSPLRLPPVLDRELTLQNSPSSQTIQSVKNRMQNGLDILCYSSCELLSLNELKMHTVRKPGTRSAEEESKIAKPSSPLLTSTYYNSSQHHLDNVIFSL